MLLSSQEFPRLTLKVELSDIFFLVPEIDLIEESFYESKSLESDFVNEARQVLRDLQVELSLLFQSWLLLTIPFELFSIHQCHGGSRVPQGFLETIDVAVEDRMTL